MQQLALSILQEERDRLAQDDLRQIVRAVVENVGTKVVADALKVSLAVLSHGLTGYENRSLRFEWLPVIDRLDPQRRITRWFASNAGFDVSEVDRRTDAEKLREALSALEDFGPKGVEAIKARRLG